MKLSINKKLFGSKELLIINYSLLILFSSCSISKQISKDAKSTILSDSSASKGFIGISIYDPATEKYLYNYNATKYFTPASNTKLFSLYAGMKYLGDSLVGLRYSVDDEYATSVTITPTGDPTFLHKDFSKQPVLDFLKTHKNIVITEPMIVEPYGRGWAWDDYMESYMAPRSTFPVYGNVVTIKWIRSDSLNIEPKYFKKTSSTLLNYETGFEIIKQFQNNHFDISVGTDKLKEIPFDADIPTVTNLLEDILKNTKVNHPLDNYNRGIYPIHSQPSDSLFRPMMHRSDNFFAEQTLLMASNERLGYMSDKDIIDTLLHTDLKDIPQKPKWVDGSGLSRYNLFTSQSFIYILNKLRNEFGWDRIKNILPTGGQGTLSSYFRKDSGFIYAKTGTLSNNCALSGFLITNSGKLLIFSILANHYQTGATPIRQASERFLEAIREKY